MNKESRKHHYVPRSLLSNFTIDDNKKSVFVFDKKDRRCFVSSIGDAGAERDFNRTCIDGKDINFEDWFQKLDSKLSKITRRIIEYRSVVNLNDDDLIDLYFLVACQFIRTKYPRLAVRDLYKNLVKWIKDLELSIPDSEDITDVNNVTVNLFSQLHVFASMFRDKDLLLLVSEERPLWISDNPITIFNAFPYGDIGIKSPGVEIYYPIASDLCLAFFCPSIKEIVSESADPAHPRPSSESPISIELYKAFTGQRILNLDNNYSTYLNELQVLNSIRFIYSREDNFELVDEVVNRNPDVADKRSYISFNSKMAPDAKGLVGTFLVVYKGHKHYALIVDLIENKSPFIDFTTPDLGKLKDMLQHSPFDNVVLYKDGKGIRGMRDVIFVFAENDGGDCIRVKHREEFLNCILERS